MATDSTPRRTAYPAEQFAPGFDTELLRFINWIASASCSQWATYNFLSRWTTTDQEGESISGWAVLALPDSPEGYEVMTDAEFRTTGKRQAHGRPVFTEASPKRALVDAFEAFAAERRRAYALRDED